jgi:diphthamide biosynthesis protein 2
MRLPSPVSNTFLSFSDICYKGLTGAQNTINIPRRRGDYRIRDMASHLTAPPVLSTPDSHILSEGFSEPAVGQAEHLSDEQLAFRYEIDRTVAEIKRQRWQRVALQFPDQMLPYSAKLYQLLARGLKHEPRMKVAGANSSGDPQHHEKALGTLSLADVEPTKLTILADTSYGSCCVDEIAAEHINADAVVHYGRACLSPTVRLPVLHIYTKMQLNMDNVVSTFRDAFPNLNAKVVVTADMPYELHVVPLVERLRRLGYSDLFAAKIVHDPSSSIPNRTVPATVAEDAASLSVWNLFHVSEPPTSLLLTLQSRMSTIRVYSTTELTSTPKDMGRSTSLLLRKRYALITSLVTVPIWGILINTLSVKNYMSILAHIQSLIASKRKKSYLFVVGKLNPAKLANFSEIGGWVVIGCWESSLIDSRDFFRPMITPFELEMALTSDERRVWTGQWRGDFQQVLDDVQNKRPDVDGHKIVPNVYSDDVKGEGIGHGYESSASEDEPPEFDLRTGRYVAQSRPVQRYRPLPTNQSDTAGVTTVPSTALTKKAKGDLVSINGIASPAAEFLAQNRTWRGLGSDFELKYEESEAEPGSIIEEGRTGIASGYTVGGDMTKT